MKTTTWKIVYHPKVFNAGNMGVALIEAATKHDAMYTFGQQYAGEYSTIKSCNKLLG